MSNIVIDAPKTLVLAPQDIQIVLEGLAELPLKRSQTTYQRILGQLVPRPTGAGEQTQSPVPTEGKAQQSPLAPVGAETAEEASAPPQTKGLLLGQS